MKNPPRLGMKKVPDTYVIVFMIMILAAILTYIIPAGQYSTFEGTTAIAPNSFHTVEQNPTTLMDFLESVPKGMKQGMSIIVFTILIGGYFGVVNDTGAIDRVIGALVRKTGDKAFIIIPTLIMAILTVLGAFGVVLNAVVAFVPIGIALAKKLKVDPVFGVAVMYCGAYSGFGSSPVCPINVVIAQEIAELPMFSGAMFRCVVWFLLWLTAVIYTLRYGMKIRKDPSRSIMAGEYDFTSTGEEKVEKVSTRDVLIMLTLGIGLGIFTYGAIAFGWDTDAMDGIMLAVALITAVIARMNPDKVVKSFVDGCKGMVYGVVIIAFSTAISVILTEGNVIHSIVHGLSIPLSHVPTTFSAVLMYWVNILINFFIPSGSGQAATVMPIMAPLSDVIGMSRQLAVCAFQFGDGLSNAIIPTSGVLMATIAAGKVPYQKWLRFMLPLFVIWTIITTVAMVVGAVSGYGFAYGI